MEQRTPMAQRSTRLRGTPVAGSGTDQGQANEVRQLKMIGKRPMIAALERALERGFERCFPSLRSHQTRPFRAVVREEFARLLGRNGKRIRGRSKSGFLLDLQRSRNQVLLQRDAAREELRELKDKSEVLQDMLETDEDTFAAYGNLFAADEDKLKDRLRELFDASQRGTFGRREMERRVIDAALRWGREEREQAYEVLRDGQARQVGNYEKRIAKLVETVRGNERELRRLERLKNIDTGVPSIYKSVQGLPEDEDDFDEKLVILQQVFEANMELHAQRRGRASDAEPAPSSTD